MRIVKLYVHMLTDEGKNAANIAIQVQMFMLSSNRWQTISNLRTATTGKIGTTIRLPTTVSGGAAALRLVEAGNPAVRVLAEGGMMRYDARSQTLSIDFGTIERLEETAYALKASTSTFSRTKHTVAGQAQRGVIAQPMMIRAMSTMNRDAPGRVANVSAVTARAEAARAVVVPTAVAAAPAVASIEPSVLKTQLARFTAREVELQTEVEKQRASVVTRDDTIRSLRAQLTSKTADYDSIKAKHDRVQTQLSGQQSITALASNIGGQLHAADATLKANKHGFRLGNVKLNLRGVISGDGSKISMPTAADLANKDNKGSLQDVTVELNRDTESDADDTVTVPDVTGLTETAARRVLQSVGLRLETITQVLAPSARTPVGQSILQAPKAGAAHERGGSVLVTFATKAAEA